ncbi:hypothetical protein I33_0660 [Bacillus subtilis subsp. subtilis str. RO-NN-1]|nr:hypothetical protein I33_0660 [Bacillus subtilis subsp. subtilis str. RO-NN-1]
MIAKTKIETILLMMIPPLKRDPVTSYKKRDTLNSFIYR